MTIKTRNSNPRSRFDEIQKMLDAGCDRNQIAAKMGITRQHLSRHIREMEGRGQMNKRPEMPFLEQIKHIKLCSFCGFRFNPLLKDGASTRCETCYQYILKKMDCRQCGKVFVDTSRGPDGQRAYCWDCKPATSDITDKIPRMWRDERWFSMFSQHQEGCLTCGGLSAKTRDGRFCSWRHDPDYLDDQEAEVLLERYWKAYAPLVHPGR